MAHLTEADKRDFVHFVIGILEENAQTIADEGKANVSFDTGGYKTMLEAKNQAVKAEEAKEDAMEEQRQKQTKIANEVLDDAYKNASDTAEAIIGHMGKDHTLSHVISKERGSKHQSGGGGDAGTTEGGEEAPL